MNKIVNHLPTKDLQALDAAHHMHPFTENAELAKKGVKIITAADGVIKRTSGSGFGRCALLPGLFERSSSSTQSR